jgi:Ca2+-binding EF-hand superfamily protein
MKQNIDEQMLYETFHYFDKEQKGFLTQDDLVGVLRRNNMRKTTDAISEIVSDFSFKNPQNIDIEEFRRMMNDGYRSNFT